MKMWKKRLIKCDTSALWLGSAEWKCWLRLAGAGVWAAWVNPDSPLFCIIVITHSPVDEDSRV